uniref:Uncharacterized protein n=1 Tax=Romanomermis culicivorax TaxID=13658 RepID=A0A915KGA2_ROMCU
MNKALLKQVSKVTVTWETSLKKNRIDNACMDEVFAEFRKNKCFTRIVPGAVALAICGEQRSLSEFEPEWREDGGDEE